MQTKVLRDARDYSTHGAQTIQHHHPADIIGYFEKKKKYKLAAKDTGNAHIAKAQYITQPFERL